MEPFYPKGKKESSNKTIRLPDDLIHRIEEIMKTRNTSFSAIVTQCCEYALDHMENNKEE